VIPKAKEYLGPSQDLANVLYHLAVSMRRSGRGNSKDALSNLSEAQTILEGLYGGPENAEEKASFYTDILYEQANIYEEDGERERALEKYNLILRLKANEADESPKVASARWRAGEIYSVMNELDKAEFNLQKAYDGYKRQQVRDDKSLVSCGLSLAKVLAQLNKFSRARQTVKDVELEGREVATGFREQIESVSKDISAKESSASSFRTFLSSFSKEQSSNSLSSLLPGKSASTSNLFSTSTSTNQSSSASSSNSAATNLLRGIQDSRLDKPWHLPAPAAPTIESRIRSLSSFDKTSTFNREVGTTSGVASSSDPAMRLVRSALGVRVMVVRRNSPCFDRLQIGDEILSVDGVKVATPVDVFNGFRKHGHGQFVTVQYRRGKSTQVANIKL
jgi:tetratricopeptide (TPR) repeat protein